MKSWVWFGIAASRRWASARASPREYPCARRSGPGLLSSVVRVRPVGEGPRRHLVPERGHRAGDLLAEVRVGLDELRRTAEGEPEEVGDHERLPVAVRAGPDPDRGH